MANGILPFDGLLWPTDLCNSKPDVTEEDDWGNREAPTRQSLGCQKGYTGYIHNVVHDAYLKDHESPEDIEYYLCGPPMMNTSVINMLINLGVEEENIMLDDFGG